MKLTDAVVKKLPPPVSGNKVHYDDNVPGFGVRVTAAGARSFVLNYVTKAGRERRLTIGSFPDWTAGAARTEAKETRKRIDLGQDPLGDIHAVRGAPTVSDLASKFLGEHSSKKRPRTQREHSDMTAAFILPAIGSMKVAEVTDFGRQCSPPENHQARDAYPGESNLVPTAQDVRARGAVEDAVRQSGNRNRAQ